MKKTIILLALVAATALVTTSCESKKSTPVETEVAPVDGAVESDSTVEVVEEVATEEVTVEEVK